VSQRVLGVFAKWPVPGAVKTRLGLSPQGAAEAARAFLRDTLDRLAGLDARRMLVFSPAEAEADFAALAGQRYTLAAQGKGDLGARLARFFLGQCDAGARQTVVVGSDSPTLPVEHVEAAFAALQTADVVLGPATDGGYYLLGCGPRLPPVFDGIAWSGSTVLADTVARLADPGWRLTVLPPWYDVDTPEGWAMLRGHVAALRRAGIDPGVGHTEALLQET
jgi:rSAM/selenodomain-associated transferase 1